jgi:pyruvate/2-oxoglutarate dehydrogenase complex dihydrolipoamide dehydrogenase (E3) component
VRVELGRAADAEAVAAHGADVVVVATGARPRRPPIPGADAPSVLDIRDVLAGRAQAGRRVVVVAQDDDKPPLSLADFLSARGCAVTLIYGAQSPGRLLGKYTIGALLGRLDGRGVTFRCMTDVVAIGEGALELRNVYSDRAETLTDFDSVVLACGGEADSSLFHELRAGGGEVHLLGDAFAPRRLDFAMREARALAARV